MNTDNISPGFPHVNPGGANNQLAIGWLASDPIDWDAIPDEGDLELALAELSEPHTPPANDTAAQSVSTVPDPGPLWLIQRGSFYWMREGDSYGDAFAASELRVHLARNRFPHRIYTDSEGKSQRTSKARLEDNYITPARRTTATYMARENQFNPKTRVMTLAVLDWAALTPKYHAHVAKWLQALSGPAYPNFQQWIASMYSLDRPAPLLNLVGGRDIGKSLLGDGLAQIWSRTSAGDFGESMSSFNEQSRCMPLQVSDEGFPDGLCFTTLRKRITARNRRINEKNQPKYDLYGCERYPFKCRRIPAACSTRYMPKGRY